MKCLSERTNKETPTTPLRLHLNKKLCKNEIGNHTNRESNNLTLNTPQIIKKENKNKKKINKTTLNFFSKKNKNSEMNHSNIPRFKYTKTPEKIKAEKEFMKHERNLKSICESMLIDVDKDELLVNDNKIIISGSIPELLIKPEENKPKNLDDIFKNCVKYFLEFLTLNEIFKLCRTKKEILRVIINLKINKTEKSIDNINSILKVHNINENKNLIIAKKLKPFELNTNSIKAISLLNSISKINFIKSIKSFSTHHNNKNKEIKKIILIFDLYFISIGKKNILNNLYSDNNKKIEFICNYFKNNKNKLLGNIIENDLKNKKFDDFIINDLYKYSEEYIDLINPNYYKKINKDIAIFVFIIKNILDFVGISNIKLDNINNEQKIIFIHNSRLKVQNIILDKLNQILNKFN